MLRLLPLKAIVNGTTIYEFEEGKPLLIDLQEGSNAIEISNGFHNTKIITESKSASIFYEVKCRIDDVQLIAALIGTILFFALFIFTDVRIFMIVANIPLLIILYILFFHKRQFLKILPLIQ